MLLQKNYTVYVDFIGTITVEKKGLEIILDLLYLQKKEYETKRSEIDTILLLSVNNSIKQLNDILDQIEKEEL